MARSIGFSNTIWENLARPDRSSRPRLLQGVRDTGNCTRSSRAGMRPPVEFCPQPGHNLFVRHGVIVCPADFEFKWPYYVLQGAAFGLALTESLHSNCSQAGDPFCLET